MPVPVRHPELAKDLLKRSTSVRTGLGAGRGEILHCVQNDVGGGVASSLSSCVIQSLRRIS